MTATHLPGTNPRSPGRPREFDMDAALDGAIGVFRTRGYHAASIADLSAAMGLTAGSLYKAFADKRAIFLAAYLRYTAVRHAQLRAAMAGEMTGLGQVQAMLRLYIASSTGSEGETGCLVTGSVTALSTFDADMAQAVRASVHTLERLFETTILAGQRDGSIPAAIDAADCACGLLCLVQGFRIVGKLGYAHKALTAAADQLLRGIL